MRRLSKRTTVYFDPAIHQALKRKAAASNISVSKVIDEAVRSVVGGPEVITAHSNTERVKAFARKIDRNVIRKADKEIDKAVISEINVEKDKGVESEKSYGSMLRALKSNLKS